MSEEEEENEEDEASQCLRKLGHDMAKFLRYTAYDECILDEKDWIRLRVVVGRLQSTYREVVKAVRLSDRLTDQWGVKPRFDLWMSGSKTWIKANDGEYYRLRSQAKHSSSERQANQQRQAHQQRKANRSCVAKQGQANQQRKANRSHVVKR